MRYFRAITIGFLFCAACGVALGCGGAEPQPAGATDATQAEPVEPAAPEPTEPPVEPRTEPSTAPRTAPEPPAPATKTQPPQQPLPQPEPRESGEPAALGCLRAAYADFVEGVESDPETKQLTVVMNDGTKLLWDDGAEKSYEQRLANPDLEDQFSISYPLGRDFEIPATNDDPGRIRVEGLFRAVYGKNSRAVRDNLVKVDWMPSHSRKRLVFNKQNGAAEALGRVSAELEESLPAEMIKFAVPSAGTFNWRKIAGTDRLSVHSFAIAIDINVKFSNYWRWALKRNPVPVYRNQIPLEIVEVFENHGFVWGGKWYHYDTMHFEYRPELLARQCLRKGGGTTAVP